MSECYEDNILKEYIEIPCGLLRGISINTTPLSRVPMILHPRKWKILFVSATMLLFGCGGGDRWYNQDQTQADFDRASQECEVIAHEMARQATLTGKMEDLETFISTYNRCLYTKGWSTVPPTNVEEDGVTAFALAELRQDNTLHIFGHDLKIPAGFSHIRSSKQNLGPTIMESFLLQGPDVTYLNVTVQKAVGEKFEPSGYPVNPPFFLYEKGEGKKGKDTLHWSLFAGKYGDDWLVVLGGFILLSKQERVLMTFTKPLPARVGKVFQGLRLTEAQFAAVEDFRNQWLLWLEEFPLEKNES